MGDTVRGTVTPLSDSISVHDAENAAKKVAEAIEAQTRELQTLQAFSAENRALHKLLLDLPDLVSYNIMVPFGKAAFMPGRLIHTNEFMVLLGEGYYAERSAKQAAEILRRQGEIITTKMDAVKEHVKDLEAEASFARETAAEAAGGLVEIREEYVEPGVEATVVNDMATTTTQEDQTDSDGEHSRIMARLAELEMAEEAAGEDEEEDEDEDDEEDDEEVETNLRAAFRRSLLEDSDEDEEDEEDELDLDDRTAANTLQNSIAGRFEEIEEEDSPEASQSSIVISQHGAQAQPRERGSQNVAVKPAAGLGGQRHVQFSEREEVAKVPSSEPLPPRNLKASAAQQRAFSGSVVERNTDLLSPAAPAAPQAPPSRPVSKFKQRKG